MIGIFDSKLRNMLINVNNNVVALQDSLNDFKITVKLMKDTLGDFVNENEV